MKHELFKIEADYNKREEEYYTENASQYLNNYLEDALIKAFENYKKSILIIGISIENILGKKIHIKMIIIKNQF